MTKNEARKILGVTKETSRESIERRYSMYLKRYRMELEQAKMAARQDEEENLNDQANTGDLANTDVTNISETSDVASAADTAVDDGSDTADQKLAVTQDKSQRSLEQDFDQITQAYNVLMGYEVAIKEEPPSKAAPLLNKVGINEKKTKNFFFYYKYHILVAILAIIAVVLTIRGCVNRVENDFNLAFIGRFNYSNATDDLTASIKANIPEILEPGINGAYIADDNFGEQQYAMEMKATVLLVAGDIDVFIMDKACFERYVEQGAFLNLDEIAPRLGVNMEDNKEFIARIEDDTQETEDGLPENSDSAHMPQEEHLYGIDVSNSSVLGQSGVIGGEMIASIYVGSEQIDKAEKLIKLLLE